MSNPPPKYTSFHLSLFNICLFYLLCEGISGRFLINRSISDFSHSILCFFFLSFAAAGNKCSLSVLGQRADRYFRASEARSGNWDLFNLGLALVAAAAAAFSTASQF